MSLIVHNFYIDEFSGKYISEPLPGEPGAELAGFERWRTEVWGSPFLIELGAKFLPRLSHGDLWIENGELLAFKNEVAMLIKNVERIASRVGYEADLIKHRLNNFLEAIKRARPIIGGVSIG